MKRNGLKKLIMAVVTIVMVLGMATSAFAAQNISVKPVSDEEYTAYKVLSAEAIEGTTLYQYTPVAPFTDLSGAGIGGYTFKAADNSIVDGDGKVVVSVFADDTNTDEYKATDAAKLAGALAAKITSETEGTKLPADLEPGYYIIVESKKSTTENNHVATKPILVSVTNDTDAREIVPKNDEITLEKGIVTGDADEKTQVAPVTEKNDVNIGDTVPYQVETSIPVYKANVDPNSLHFALKDTFSAGLDYQDNTFELYIDGKAVAADAYTKSYDTDARELKIELNSQTVYANQGKAVVVKYKAILNENAQINEAGNKNTVKLEYTNNPDKDNDYKELTDDTETYTYGFGIHKVEKDKVDTNLPNAEFEIRATQDGDAIQFVKNADGTYTKATQEQIDDENVTTTTKIVSSESGKATVKGLDEGTYYIKETKAPDGYTIITDAIVVKITANKGEDGLPDGTAELSKVSDNAQVEDKDGNKKGEIKISGDDIQAFVLVEDVKGISLPETGRKTAMYCMIGGVALVILGGLYYVLSARKKTTK